MPLGPMIPDTLKTRIAELFLAMREKDPQVSAKTVREAVLEDLREHGPDVRPGWPSLSAVQKVLADVRNREREQGVDPEDEQWSLDCIDRYPIPPQALPYVFGVWKLRAQDIDMELFVYARHLSQQKGLSRREQDFVNSSRLPPESLGDDFTYFTIREAKWASRLAFLVTDPKELSDTATKYAKMERLSKLAGLPFESGLLDARLAKLPVIGEGTRDLWKIMHIQGREGLAKEALDRELRRGQPKKQNPPAGGQDEGEEG